MSIDDLLTSIEPDREITVVNEPFIMTGQLDITLEGGDIRHWVFDGEGSMLAIAPSEDEIIHFRSLDDELEPTDSSILYQAEEYEFTYKDSGSITKEEGDTIASENDKIEFSDYESGDGSVLRIVTNQNTGENIAFLGSTIVAEEIIPVS